MRREDGGPSVPVKTAGLGSMGTSLARVVSRFARDEDGASWTEYLLLMGLVAGAVATAGTGLASAFASGFLGWASYALTVFAAPA